MTPKGMYCRTCLCVLQYDPGRCPPVYNIFDTFNFAKKLKQCSTIHIEPYDQYPNSVCGTCYEKVLDFYEFQLMCRDSLRMFNEMYDCDNDLEEALCDEKHSSDAESRKEKKHQNDDEQIEQTYFQEGDIIDGVSHHDYNNGDFAENKFYQKVDKNSQVKVVNIEHPSFIAVQTDNEGNSVDSRELENDEILEHTICNQKQSPSFPSAGNYRLISGFNGNVEKGQLADGSGQYKIEESVTNYKEFQTNEYETINRTDHAEKDHVETIIQNSFIQQKEGEIVMVNEDMILHEIDVYTTSKTCDNVDEEKIENGVKDQTQQRMKLSKVNERNDAGIDKDNAATRRRSQRIGTCKEDAATSDQLSKKKKIAPGSPLNKTLIEIKSKPTKKFSFCCNICSKSFRFHHGLEAHKRHHQGLQGYPCTHENCKSIFDRFPDLFDHLNDHDGIPRTVFKCENNNCEREFTRKSGLTLHMKKIHKCLPAKQRHECVTCGKIFNDSKKLGEHSFIHKDKSTWLYTCDVEGCMRKCRTWIHMRIHKNRHAGIKKFTCPHCGIAKTTSQELRSHINFHTSERTWSCEHCTKVCKTLANLHRHIKNKHSGSKRELKCSYCEATFATIEVKKSHEKRHTSDKPHVCEECGMRFIWAYRLRAHQNTHRGKTNLEGTKTK